MYSRIPNIYLLLEIKMLCRQDLHHDLPKINFNFGAIHCAHYFYIGFLHGSNIQSYNFRLKAYRGHAYIAIYTVHCPHHSTPSDLWHLVF